MYTIDGRIPGKEKNDCTVRALSVATDIPYEVAWLALAMCNRRKGSGLNINDWIKAYQANNLCKDEDILDKLEYQILMHTGNLDNVIVHCHRHIFSIRNGKHSDGTAYNPNPKYKGIVYKVWRIK